MINRFQLAGAGILVMSLVLAEARAMEIAAVHQTPFLRKTAEGMENLVKLHLRSDQDISSTTIALTAADATVSTVTALQKGENIIDLLTANVSSPTTATVTVSHSTAEQKAEYVLKPVKQWKIFATPSIHVDIGYTDARADVIRRHNDNLDQVIQLCQDDPDFRWNVEVSWELQNYAENRSTSQTKLLFDLIRQGRIGVHAGYLNMLTALMSDEAMNRYSMHSAELARREQVKTQTLILSDVPSATGALPSALASSGIRYFAEGCNMDRGPMLQNSGFSNPFWWQGPDGKRVLAYLSMMYARTAWMAECPTLQCFEEHIPRMIEPLRPDYPSDAVYLYGAFLDNRPFNAGYMKFMAAYKERWDYPEIRISTSDEFFEYLEKDCGDKLETKQCDFGAFWEDGAGSTAFETTLHMENQRRLVAAETLFSLAKMADSAVQYPAARIEKAWQDVLFYIEHTWGAADSINKPDDPLTLKQWADKSEFAHRPAQETEKLLEESLQGYAKAVAQVGGSDKLIVVNSLPIQRSGVVRLNAGAGPLTVLSSDGEALQTQADGTDLLALVPEVPPMGHGIIQVKSSATAATQTDRADEEENPFYTVRTDPGKGITSIIDKESGKELLDSTQPFGFAQVVYAHGGRNTRMTHSTHTTAPVFTMQPPLEGSSAELPAEPNVHVYPARIKGVSQGANGPLFQDIVIESSAPNMPLIETTVRLHRKEKRISVDVKITSKTEERAKEAVYVAFPFAMKEPAFRLGMTNTVADPAKDFSPFGCHEWYCVQDFVSCRGSSGGPEVVWTSPDAPLVCLSDINRGSWQHHPELTTATIFSYAMNNYWHTNYKAGQGGDFRFRYDLTSSAAGFSNTEALAFARSAATPLLSANPGPSAPSKSGKESPGIKAEGHGVIIGGLRRSADNKGYILRLRNAEVQETSATVTAKGQPLKYRRVSHVENELDPPVKSLTDPVRLTPYETVTLYVAD